MDISTGNPDGAGQRSVMDPLPVSKPTPAQVSPGPTNYRQFGDVTGTRKLIFNNILQAAQGIEAVSNPRHSLAIEDVKWAGPDTYSYEDQKKAVLSRGTLARQLRGTFVMRDNEGNVIAKRPTQLARVPWLTDRGTFILGGNEYTMAHQMRLRPGIFTRRKANGEYESHVNVSKGFGHKIFLDPESGVFRIEMGQAKIPLIPLLRAMGVQDKELREAWGNELTAANMQKDDPRAVGKIYSKLFRDGKADDIEKKAAVVKAFQEMELDPEVTRQTLGSDHTNVDAATLMAITKKLVRVARNEEDSDDRDSLAFQTLLGPEDLFAERLKKSKHILRQLLWKASPRGHLDSIQSSPFTDTVKAALMSSGLGMPLEEINPADIFDQQVRVTRMGEGGIPSLDAVPDEARAVQPSQFGFIDFLRTPESGKVGVDARLARAAVKGPDGRIYTKVMNTKTGEQEYKSPQDLVDAVVAFPNELARNKPYVAALTKGKVRMVPREAVNFEVPDMESTFSPLGNMIPLKSMVKGQRAVMAARMLTQALPLKDAEAPLVQSGIPGQEGRSFEEEYANALGAIRYSGSGPGTVVSVDQSGARIKTPEGRTERISFYENFPFNRKTFIHHTPKVRPGQVIQPGQLLASSNFTDADGTAALGKNARVAYIPWRGLNFEDAIVISKSFADRMSSEHMYQNAHEWEKTDHKGRNAFVSIFPSTYDRKKLANFDEKGVIKPGTEVKEGDPLILIAREKERNKKSLIKGGKPSYSDVSVKWDHGHSGVVTDVVHTDKGTSVVVKATMPMEVGDKLCFDPETYLLTEAGWKRVAEITYQDRLATLNPETDCLEWHTPDQLHTYDHAGQMYSLKTKHLDMLVTPNHDLWVARPGQSYQKITAQEFYNSKGEWQFKKDCKWIGEEQALFRPPDIPAFSKRDNRIDNVAMDTWLEFLGYYIAEGRKCRTTGGGWQVQISQFRKSEAWAQIANVLTELELRWYYNSDDNRFEVNSKQLFHILDVCGDNAYNKKIPEYVKNLSARQQLILFDAYMAGDGHKGSCWEYGTSSSQLSFDLEVLVLKLGWCTSPREVNRDDNFQKNPHWRSRVNRKHLRPWWKKSRVNQYDSVTEEMVDYTGKVYCVTVSNHLIYAKRGGKSYWSGNSGRYG